MSTEIMSVETQRKLAQYVAQGLSVEDIMAKVRIVGEAKITGTMEPGDGSPTIVTENLLTPQDSRFFGHLLYRAGMHELVTRLVEARDQHLLNEGANVGVE